MKYKHIHFIGVKGVGMTPLAILAKEAGCTVTGCDIADTFITDAALEKADIHPEIGFNADHLSNVDLVITTGAHGGYDNKEVQAAKEKGIPVWTQGEAVGEFMKGEIFDHPQKGISIAGCHGKTTTTAMIATLLTDAGKDPSYIIGTSDIASLVAAGHHGKGEYFVAEADEYATEPLHDKTPKFLWQHPFFLVITNIEFDHPDLYSSLDDVLSAYEKLVKNIHPDGKLIINGDDPESKKIIKKYAQNIATFGLNSNNNYVLKNITISADKTMFEVWFENRLFGSFATHAIGEHNAYNALAAIIIAKEIGLNIEAIQKGLLAFTGTKRRFEYKGKLSSGALLYDDYAHHPTEIQKTLRAMKQLCQNKKIVCIFQPHTLSRTKILFEQFIYSFKSADVVLLSDIYASLREKKDDSISTSHLANEMKKIHDNVVYLPSITDVVNYLNTQNYGQEYIIVTMGAGDIYKIHEKLKHT